MDTDTALARQLAADLDGTFERMVVEHRDRVFSIALRFLDDRDDAEDVAQEAFIRAYRALSRYDTTRRAALRLRPWLATIVLNLCRDRTRRRQVASDVLAPGAPATPHDVTEARDGHAYWANLLRTLPASYRAAVVLRHVDGLTYPEIAEALGRSEGTVKAQVHRGLTQLRAAYEADRRIDREELTA